MSSNEQFVQAQVDAFNDRDLERFLDFYSSDALIVDGMGNQMMKGHEGMRKFYGKLFEQSPKLFVKIPTRIVLEHHIIDEEQITGVNLEGFPAEIHSAAIYRIANGKIVHVQLL
jgi:uncharacterized protein (TIGR02246 family)